MSLSDLELVGLLREVYVAVSEKVKADPDVAAATDADATLDILNTAGTTTKDFLKRFGAEQARRFADDLPGYDDNQTKTAEPKA
jgi:hypothetical protein